MKPRILLIEDDPGAGSALQKVIRAEGYEVDLVRTGEEGLGLLGPTTHDLVLTDLRLPGMSGLDLVRTIHESQPRLPIILMTAHGTTSTAIEAMKLGAMDYVVKPFEADEMLALLAAGVANHRNMSEAIGLGTGTGPTAGLVGRGRAIQALYKDIGRVAAMPVSVLVRGATGTGKELVARALYQHSDRAGRPWIAINCAAIPQALLESELFGHERGAFTGATQQRIGRFEQANGGTLFLDEIGDLPLETQGKLLRVLQERTLHRVGGDLPIPVDVRIIAATHRDLEAAIVEKDFREDLYYRLSVVTLRVPALEERREDIPDLARHFLGRYAAEFDVASPAITPQALECLSSQRWPGNVRELENVVRQALLLARPFALGVQHIEQAMSRRTSPPRDNPQLDGCGAWIRQSLPGPGEDGAADVYWRMVAELERHLFSEAMRRNQGNQTHAARWLGVTRLKLREVLSSLRGEAGGADDGLK